MAVMWMVIGLLVGAAIGAGATAVWYGRESNRMAAFLHARPDEGNARLTVGVPGESARRLAVAINEQLDRIQDERIADRTRQDEFQRDLSALSHDVRTPLMGVRGHVQLALDDLAADSAQSNGDVARHLTIAAARLDEMRGLLDQLFDYARAKDPDRGPKIETVPLHPLLAQTLVGHYPEFEERGWEPTIDFADESVAVEADRASLARMLENLTVNALRHGDGAPVIVERSDPDRPGMVRLTFANPVPAGVSIDPDRLFARFYRADEARGGVGTGLGLAVVQSLAERMGMTVDAELAHAGLAGAGGEKGGTMLTIGLTMKEAGA